MKTILFSLLAVVFAVNANNHAIAGGKKEKVTIQTSAQCDECVGRLTKALNKVDGVKAVSFDEAKKVTVTYDADKTNADALRSAITATGYDADDQKANAASYGKLPGCCQKPANKTE